jgi:cystathionine beta-lyase/cystathionine gamma-synthase
MHISAIINELGEDRENYFSAVAPPIMQTSNFVFNTVADLSKAFEDEMAGYLYSRGINPTVDILRKKLAALDGAEDCLVFNSGAAAIFAAILANVKSGDHIVSVRSPYTWVQRMLEVILPRFQVDHTYVEGKHIDQWREATRDNTSFYYLESPNSWDFAIQPIEEVAALAREKNIITLIDNSYCTPLYQRPIDMGMDMVMQTATKYTSGHSDTLGGILCGSHAMMKKIFDSEYLNIGSGIQPFNAWLLIRGLRTLPARIERITRTTKEVVNYLKANPLIEKIIFPLDESFEQYELAKKQMKGACGLVTIILRDTARTSIVKFCESLKHILMAVSWGGHESLVIPKCAGIPETEYDPSRLDHRYIRLYFGLEEAGYLIDDIEQALAAISTGKE